MGHAFIGYPLRVSSPPRPAALATVLALAGLAPACGSPQKKAAERRANKHAAPPASGEKRGSLEGIGFNCSRSGSTRHHWSLAAPKQESANAGIPPGQLCGVVVDKRSRKPLPGVTIAATSSALQGARTEITDSQGEFCMGPLSPGVYELGFYYADLSGQIAASLVANEGRHIGIMSVDTSAASGELALIEDNPNIIEGPYVVPKRHSCR